MATVSLLNVTVRNNPASFNSPYEFEITFECLEPLQKDLEWKLTYVGSATSSVFQNSLSAVMSKFIGLERLSDELSHCSQSRCDFYSVAPADYSLQTAPNTTKSSTRS